jgi:hypothetical protein
LGEAHPAERLMGCWACADGIALTQCPCAPQAPAHPCLLPCACRVEYVLRLWHPDALDCYNSCSDLRRVLTELAEPGAEAVVVRRWLLHRWCYRLTCCYRSGVLI